MILRLSGIAAAMIICLLPSLSLFGQVPSESMEVQFRRQAREEQVAAQLISCDQTSRQIAENREFCIALLGSFDVRKRKSFPIFPGDLVIDSAGGLIDIIDYPKAYTDAASKILTMRDQILFRPAFVQRAGWVDPKLPEDRRYAHLRGPARTDTLRMTYPRVTYPYLRDHNDFKRSVRKRWFEEFGKCVHGEIQLFLELDEAMGISKTDVINSTDPELTRIVLSELKKEALMPGHLGCDPRYPGRNPVRVTWFHFQFVLAECP